MLVSNDALGTLIVFDLILVTLLVVAAETLRIRLSAVPDQADLLGQQLQNAVRETEKLRLSNAQAERVTAELSTKIDERGAVLLEGQQRLQEARDRAPATVYILEQLIQAAHLPWLITVRRGDPSQAPAATAQAEWAAGRRFIVYGEDAANARRRIEARFPPSQGYRAGDPQRFAMS
jgi:hypothetical protein